MSRFLPPFLTFVILASGVVFSPRAWCRTHQPEINELTHTFYIISVDTPGVIPDRAAAKILCDRVHGALIQASAVNGPLPDSKCFYRKEDAYESWLYWMLELTTAQFHLIYEEKGPHSAHLHIEPVKFKLSVFDPRSWDWDLSQTNSAESTVTIQEQLQKHLNAFMALYGSEKAHQAALGLILWMARDDLTAPSSETMNGLTHVTHSPLVLGEDGVLRLRATNEVADFDFVLGEAVRRQKIFDWAVTTLELSAAIGAGVIWYYLIALDFNMQDWEHDWSWETFQKKFVTFEATAFDDNTMFVNAFGHPVAGAYYYRIARAHGFGRLESFGYSFLTSLVWEAIIEYREVLSINDVVYTPVAGAILGEVFFQFGRYFYESSSDDPIFKSVRAILGATGLTQMPGEGRRWRRMGPGGQSNRLQSRYGEYLELYLQAGSAAGQTSSSSGGIGFYGELIELPAESGIADNPVHELRLSAALGENDRTSFEMFSKAVFSSGFIERVRELEHKAMKISGRSGFNLLVGPSMSYEYSAQPTASGITDSRAVLNLLGSSLQIQYFTGDARIRLVVDLWGNLAAIRSYAVDSYPRSQAINVMKSSLKKQLTYWAIGVAPRARLEADLGPISLAARAKYYAFDSLEGVDQHPEDVMNDAPLTDQRFELEFEIGCEVPHTPLRASVLLVSAYRLGTLGDYQAQERTNLIFGKIGYWF